MCIKLKNMEIINIYWSKLKIKIKEKYIILTDCDLFLEEGKQDELVERLQLKLGKTRDEIIKLISGV